MVTCCVVRGLGYDVIRKLTGVGPIGGIGGLDQLLQFHSVDSQAVF